MTNEANQLPSSKRCKVKDCSHQWAELCRICALRICVDHIIVVKDGGIPGGHWRCPTCAKLPLEEALTVWKSPEAQHRREVFAGRILLLLQERVGKEEWHWMMEEAKSVGVDTDRFREAIRATITEMGQHASGNKKEP